MNIHGGIHVYLSIEYIWQINMHAILKTFRGCLVSKGAISHTIVVKENFKNNKAATVMVQTITITNTLGFVQSVTITK